MTTVIGQRDPGPTVAFGRYRARDGSDGGPVALDVAYPHAVCVVGKRGSGKSNTLALLAEALVATAGVVPVVVDPMGVFRGLDAVGAAVRAPAVPASAVSPAAWPGLLGLDPASGAGALVWQAASARDTLAGMREFVAEATAPDAASRAAGNHLRLAESWGVFDAEGVAAPSQATVIDLAGVAAAPANAVVRAVASACYERRCRNAGPIPWLLVDEADVFFDGVAAPALERVLTRGRAPGVGLVVATQRPTALPDVARSQSDLVVAHRLTGRDEWAAVEAARPDDVTGALSTHRPADPGDALVFDDATERAHPVRVRERATPHGGDPPRPG